MKYEVTFSENGHVMTQTFDKPDADEQEVIDWYGLREPDIEWFRIKRLG